MCAWPIAMFFRTRRRVRPRAACRRGGATLLGLLAPADGLLRPLARARVRLRALTVHGQPAPVADAAIAADLLEALDGLLPLTAQVALHLQLGVDVALELRDLGIRQVAHLRVGREAERSANLARRRLPDAVDVRQPDLEPLLLRDVDAGDACHL